MFNNISYNVVVERFKVFADGHFLIKRFTHGQVDQTDLDKDQLFPWMHVAPVEVRAAAGARVFTFDVIFADIPRDKEDKTDYQKESISDCIRLAEDLLSEIQNGQTVFGDLVEVDGESSITPFIEEWTHTLSGCTLALTISVPNNYSACDIPADWAIGGGGSGTPPSPLPSLVLRVNNVDNTVQNVLDLVNGTNITIEDLGDGRVRINSSGGGGGSVAWGAITGTLSSQVDLQNALNLKADILSLGAVAFSNDYDDLDNKPTIPDATTFVPYTGATASVDLGVHSLKANDGTTNTEVNASFFGVQNAASTKYSVLTESGITVTDVAASNVMNLNAGGLTFPDTTTQYTAAVNADWNATSGLAEILNKPTIPAAQIQSDWTQTNNAALDFIKNKPTLPGTIGDMLKSVYDTDNDGIVDFAEALKTEVRNSTGATLHKGHIVRLSGSTGNLPNAVYAQANNDANSAQTFGVVYQDISNNSDGFVITLGQINTLDTRSTAPNAFTSDTLIDGDVIYLSATTPGHITNIKPSAPQHIVYVGMVVRTSPTNGTIQYRIQNGYELDEIHNVVALSPVNNDYLYYDGSTSLYRLRQLTASLITDSTTVGQSLMKLTNPSAIRYLRVNADNTVTAISAATLKSELGLLRGVQATTLTNSNTIASTNITGCILALDANSTYIGRMVVSTGYPSTNGFPFWFTFPAGATMNVGQLSSTTVSGQFMQWQAVTSGTALTNRLNQANTQIGLATIEIFISTGATSGNLTPVFSTFSNGTTATVYGNATFIQLEKI
jgi:hypothetical protein